MSTSNKSLLSTFDQSHRITSIKGKLFLALRDGKAHNIVPIRAMLRKAGVKGTGYGTVYGLARLLRKSFGHDIEVWNFYDKTGTLRIVPFTAPKTAAPAKSKPVTKKAAPQKAVARRTAKVEATEQQTVNA